MRHFFAFFQELSLTQQFSGIVLVFVSVFLTFFYFYLNGNIDTFSYAQMSQVLKTSQDSYIYTYYKNEEDYGFILIDENPSITNAIIENGAIYSGVGFDRYKTVIFNDLLNQIQTQKQSAKTYSFNFNGQNTLYRLTFLAEDRNLVTILNSDYQKEFKSSLISTVINAIITVVALLFAIILLWVLYLINALRHLKNFIEKIRQNEPAKLKIGKRGEIGQVAEAIVSLSEEVKRQEQIKEELIQNISHDLKTPIATIKSYSESIKDGIYPYKTLENSIDVIIEHADRLDKKVHNLLLLNRIGYLTTNKDIGTVNMREIIEKTILSLKVIRPQLTIKPNLEEVEYFGDEEPWRVVMENLLDNAFRYAVSEIQIELTSQRLSVSNDGPAISAEWREKMFRPYEKGSEGSFGLGLSIVQKIVDVYGYIIYAENTANGVIFIIEPKKDRKVKRIKLEKKTKSEHR